MRKQANKQWIVVYVKPSFGWPKRATKVNFRGQTFHLRGETKTRYADVSLAYGGSQEEWKKSIALIREFLSSLSWVEGAGVLDLIPGGGGYRIRRRKNENFPRIDKLHLNYLPEATNKTTRLALAFYREALTLDHVGYKFLSFYKVINLTKKTGEKQTNWIKSALPKLEDLQACARIQELIAEKVNIPERLYNDTRCAIAHSFVKNAVVDPEDPEDRTRLESDMPIIKALAKHFIEQTLGVKSAMTVWKERRDREKAFTQM